MALDKKNLVKISGGTKDNQVFMYYTTDSFATVITADYFNDADLVYTLKAGNAIMVAADSGAEVGTIFVSSVTQTVGSEAIVIKSGYYLDAAALVLTAVADSDISLNVSGSGAINLVSTGTGDVIIDISGGTGELILTGIPTSDPGAGSPAGTVYANSNVLTLSTGS
jgi:hypothetical protein